MTERSGSADTPAKPKAKMSWRDDTLRKRLRDAIRRRPKAKKDKKSKDKTEQVPASAPPVPEPQAAEQPETPDTTTDVGTVGSILALRPREPLALEASTSVYEACKYMEAKRADCVLVLDEDGSVSGIFTARDVALSIVGEGRNTRDTKISEIMASEPVVATADVSALEALDLMASQSIRHLPVVAADDAGDDAGAVLGVLDLSRLMVEAVTLNTDKEQNIPSLADVVSAAGDSTRPLTIDLNASAAQAAKMMRENNSTAVLVADSASNQISGIVTSKDIVNRALAVNLDPSLVSVLRIMTPRPESAASNINVHDALRKMHSGNYLNLPVLDENGDIAGVVDALTLTYVALAHLRALSALAEQGQEPWTKFWHTLEETTPEPELAAPQTAPPPPPPQVPPPPPPATAPAPVSATVPAPAPAPATVSAPQAPQAQPQVPELKSEPVFSSVSSSVSTSVSGKEATSNAANEPPQTLAQSEPNSPNTQFSELPKSSKLAKSDPAESQFSLALSVLSLSVLSLSAFAFYAYKRHV